MNEGSLRTKENSSGELKWGKQQNNTEMVKKEKPKVHTRISQRAAQAY